MEPPLAPMTFPETKQFGALRVAGTTILVKGELGIGVPPVAMDTVYTAEAVRVQERL